MVKFGVKPRCAPGPILCILYTTDVLLLFAKTVMMRMVTYVNDSEAFVHGLPAPTLSNFCPSP